MIDKNPIIKLVLTQYPLVNFESQNDIPGWGTTIRKTLTLNGKSYFLKEKVPYLTSEEFITKINLHNLLQLNTGPAATLVSTHDKKQYAKFGDRYFELHEWVSGRFINYNCVNEIRILGEYTGILTHKLQILYQQQIDTSKLPNPSARSKWFPDTIDSIKCYFNNLFLLYSTNVELQIILSRLYKIVSEVSNGIDWHNLPQSIIHGDLSSDNAIFNVESGNITFIDFDNIRVSNRIWDIARLAAVIGLLYDNQLEQKQLNIEFAYDKVNTLLAGYTQNVVLNPLEKNNLTNIIIINLILAFLSEFDIDDLENTIFTPVAASVEFEKLLAMTSSLKQNLCRVLT